MDWYGVWNWIVTNVESLLAPVAGFVAGVPVWAIATIAGCLGLEGIRRMVNVARLLHHVRKFEQAEIEHRLGVVEKPAWERKQKRNKEIKIDGSTYHPLQTSPGGIWLQIAPATLDDAQSQVYLVGDVQQLIHNSVDVHSHQHKAEAAGQVAWGVVFFALGGFVSAIYSILEKGLH